MPIPEPGDILIVTVTHARFDLVDAITRKRLAGPFDSLPEAIAAARQRSGRALWHQDLDAHGQPSGEPHRLADLSRGVPRKMPLAYQQGNHICVMYETPEEQLAVAVAYLADGLRSGERIFYIADSEAALEQFRLALAAGGIDVGAALARGAIIQGTFSEAHLAHGRFDAESMLHLLDEALEAALDDGFSGLRTCGDMSWLLDDPPGASEVVAYEAMLNRFFLGVRGAGMCQYDVTRLSPELLDHALATHTSAVVDGRHTQNPFYRSPETAIGRIPQPSHVSLKIEALRRQH